MPPLYAGWLAELLGAEIPPETVATCADCAMLATDTLGSREAVAFDPTTKCCTYLPIIPNFLVGRVLLDCRPEFSTGRETIRARIARGAGVTPLGLGDTGGFRLLYEEAHDQLFGKARTLRCPHYLDRPEGNCGIWQHRNAICSTWFCKHVRGVIGKEFWSAVRDLLAEIEFVLTRWCLLELELPDEIISRVLPPRSGKRPVSAHEIDGRIGPDYAAGWGLWADREVEFYERCAALVVTLTWTEVLRIGGAVVALHANHVKSAHAALVTEDLPQALRVASYRVEISGRETVRLVTYSDYDPIELPRALVDEIDRFDDGDLDAVLGELEHEAGIAMDRMLVRRLMDFGLLRARDVK